MSKDRDAGRSEATPLPSPSPERPEPEAELRRRLRDLQLREAELEAHNETLRRAQQELDVLRRHYVELYEGAPVPYCILDAEGRIRQANLAAARLLGLPAAELSGQDLQDFILEEDVAVFQDHLRGLLASEGEVCDLRMRRQDKTFFWGRLRSVGAQDAEGRPVCRVAFADVTPSKQVEDALRRQKDFFLQIAEHLSDFIAVLDLEGRRLYNSPSYQHFFGPSTHLLNTDSFADIHPDDRERVRQVFRETVRSGHGHRIEYRFMKADGSVRDMESRGSLIAGSAGEAARVLVVSQDITERKQLQEQVHKMAFHDVLTALPNRRLFSDRLGQTLAAVARNACYGALMFLDLDSFKPLNDAYGHDVGDLLLIQAAERLKHCVREMDTVARFGGDEFVVMLSQLDGDSADACAHAEAIAEKLRVALSEAYLLPLGDEPEAASVVEHWCTASVGVTLFGDHDATPTQILKQADWAMYQAKQAGGNQVRVWGGGRDGTGSCEEALR